MDLEVHLEKFIMAAIISSSFITRCLILQDQETTGSESLPSISMDLATTVMKQFFKHVLHLHLLQVQLLAKFNLIALELLGILHLTMAVAQLHNTNYLGTMAMVVT